MAGRPDRLEELVREAVQFAGDLGRGGRKMMPGELHIYAPAPTGCGIYRDVCPDCGKRSAFVYRSFEWFGPDQTCLRCGRSWSDGEWMPLDFERGARQKSIERAKTAYRRAREMSSLLDVCGGGADNATENAGKV